MNIRTVFAAANALLVGVFLLAVLPGRVFVFRGQEATLRLRERQFVVWEENYLHYAENAAMLSALLDEYTGRVIIQPAGELAVLLGDVRNMLHSRGLAELEFYANEQAVHYIDGQLVTETRATIVTEGDFAAFAAFIEDAVRHYRYLRVGRIQVSETRMWVTFSVYTK